MIISPKTPPINEPRITFYASGGTVSFNKEACQKLGFTDKTRIKFDVDYGKVNILVDNEGFVLTYKKGNICTLRMRSINLWKALTTYFNLGKALHVSFLVGTNENGVIELILGSMIVKY